MAESSTTLVVPGEGQADWQGQGSGPNGSVRQCKPEARLMGQLCCCLVWPGPSHYCGPGSVTNAGCNWAYCPGISCLLSCPSSQQSKALVWT